MRAALLSFCLLAAAAGAAEAPAKELGATVFGVKPVAKRYLADGIAAPLKVGHQLWFGDRLLLQPSGQVKLVLIDGSTLKVEGGSDLTLEKPAGAMGSLLKLAKGLVRVVAAKQEGGSRLRLNTSSAAIAVKGTQFQVEAKDGSTELKVLEGAVEIAAAEGTTPTAVSAGEAVLSYPDRVDTVRKLSFQEVKALRGAFRDLVEQQKKEYARRVREAKGKRTTKQGGQ